GRGAELFVVECARVPRRGAAGGAARLHRCGRALAPVERAVRRTRTGARTRRRNGTPRSAAVLTVARTRRALGCARVAADYDGGFTPHFVEDGHGRLE